MSMLEVKDLKVNYGMIQAIKGVSFHVEQGEVIALIGATPLMKKLIIKINNTEKGAKVLNIAEPIVMTVLLVVMTAFLVDGSFNPFLYFRF